MAEKSGITEQERKLTTQVVNLNWNLIRLQLPALSAATRMLPMEISPGTGRLATDGERLVVDPAWMLRVYRMSQSLSLRNQLHLCMHCLLGHIFPPVLVPRRYWNLSCDMIVEATISALGFDAVLEARQKQQQVCIRHLLDHADRLTETSLAEQLQKMELNEEKLREMEHLFEGDDHRLWMRDEAESGSSEIKRTKRQKWCSLNAKKTKWKQVAVQCGQTMARTCSERQELLTFGDRLRMLAREKPNLRSVLEQIMVSGEDPGLSQEEFDYISYCTGFSRGLPLLEPVEGYETRRIRELVVAIDTSGSVYGEPVIQFLTKLVQLVHQENCYFQEWQVRILQCDEAIREEAVIRSGEELSGYLEHLMLRGFQGTDFRPVFAHIEELRRQGQLQDMGGLIYLTDGMGAFPQEAPDYKTLFLFVGQVPDEVRIPPWVTQIALEPSDLNF